MSFNSLITAPEKEAPATPTNPISSTAPEARLTVEANVPSAIWARFMAPYLSGTETVCRCIDLPRGSESTSDPSCVPEERITLEFATSHQHMVLVETATYSAIIQTSQHRHGSAWVRARTREQIDEAAAEVASWFPVVEPPEKVVSIDFWQSNRGMFTTSRSIDAPQWSNVSHHYPGDVGSDLEAMMNLELDAPEGRVVLWHGPPGTGKTSAIRTLARAWREQARFQVVLDPEPVFSHSANLMQVVLDSDDSEESHWRVLVIEDADEIVRADNATTSQSLSRLLNVGDGIVGQGLKVLVLLTTNEPPDRLHPALSRPGRCLANIAFRRFDRAEMTKAFPDHALVKSARSSTALTLAEILNGRTDGDHGLPAPGLYL